MRKKKLNSIAHNHLQTTIINNFILMQTDKASILDPFAGNFPHTTKLQMFNYSGTTMTKQLRFRSTIPIYFCFLFFFVKDLRTHATREVYHVPASSSARTCVPCSPQWAENSSFVSYFSTQVCVVPHLDRLHVLCDDKETASNMLPPPCNLVHASARVHTGWSNAQRDLNKKNELTFWWFLQWRVLWFSCDERCT